MFCDDFIFCNKWLSDLGLMICNFDGGEPTRSGGEVTFITNKPPGSNKHSFYATSNETPISMVFSIGKNPCYGDQDDIFFTAEEQSYIQRWLVREDGFHWLGFDEEGFEDIWFNSQINLSEIFIAGKVAGYEVNVNTDSPHAYSQEFYKEFTLNPSSTFVIKNYSDRIGDIYPWVQIKPKSSGTIKFETGCNYFTKTTEIKNVTNTDIVILDGNNDYYEGISNANDFNHVFPVMGNSYDDIDTYFINNSTITLDISIVYRFERRVAV